MRETLKRGKVVSSRCDSGLFTMKLHDKRDVVMLSSYHGDEMVSKSRRSRAAEGGVEEIQKPRVVEDYNRHMGGVDQSKYLHNNVNLRCGPGTRVAGGVALVKNEAKVTFFPSSCFVEREWFLILLLLRLLCRRYKTACLSRRLVTAPGFPSLSAVLRCFSAQNLLKMMFSGVFHRS